MNKPVNEWTLGDLRKWMQEHDADVSFYRTGDMWMAHVRGCYDGSTWFVRQDPDLGKALELAMASWICWKETK